MRTCNNCGAQLDDDAIFCPECGTKTGLQAEQQVEPQKKVCPNCGAVIDNDSLFCPECGVKIENDAQPIINLQPQEQPHKDSSAPKSEKAYSGDDILPNAEQKNNKWLYAIGGIAVLALIAWGSILFWGQNNKGNKLLPVQEPEYEKFVIITSDEVLVFKEATGTSAKLEIMNENLDSDVASHYFKWDDTANKRGYSSHVYMLSRDRILPMIDEKDGWCKVIVSEEGMGLINGYVNKSLCREIQPTPITAEILQNLKSYNWHEATFTLETDGKYKNICFISVQSEMEGEWCDAAVLYDGVLINPLTKRASTLVGTGTDTGLLFENMVTSLSPIEEVSYYFPEIDKEHLFTFIQDVSGSQSSADIEGVEDKFSGFAYLVERGEYGFELFAEIADDKRTTSITGEKIVILDQADYDGDGEREALVYEWGGGNSIEPPFIIYFDKEADEFKKSTGFNDAIEDPDIKVEEWKGHISFRIDVGLRKDRYIYENHSISLAESIAPDIGEICASITTSQLFGDSEETEEKTAHIDIDCDGEKDNIVFIHDSSHSMDWGKCMILKDMSTSYFCLPDIGREHLGVRGYKFSFLKSTSQSMPDILCDDAWLYKWNDGNYVLQQTK